MKTQPRPLLTAFWPLSLLVVIAAAACLAVPKAPSVAPRSTLGLAGSSRGGSGKGPLRVEFSSPNGDTTEDPQITLLFSSPVRRIEADPGSPRIPIRLNPDCEGHWEWIGTRMMRFVPKEGRLPRATDFEVEVPAGVQPLSGTALAQPHRFQFSTPRPRVLSMSVDPEPSAPVNLTFSQQVSIAELLRATRIVASTPTGPVAIPFEPGQPGSSESFSLSLRAPLPPGAEVRVEVEATLRSEEGPRTLGKTWTESFKAYGPFRVKEANCYKEEGASDCTGGITLLFSGPVRPSVVREAMRITPAVKLEWTTWDEPSDYLDIPATFEPGKTYRIEVHRYLPALQGKPARPVVDQYGLPLTKEWTGTFKFAAAPPLQPWAGLDAVGDVIDGDPPRALNISSQSLSQVEVTTTPLSLEEYVQTRLKGKLEEGTLARAKRWVVRTQGGKARLPLDSLFPATPGGKGAGAVAIGIPGADPPHKFELWMPQVTGLGITGLWTPLSNLVWVTRLSDATPVAGAQVRVFADGDASWSVQAGTDADGVAVQHSAFPLGSGRVAFSAEAGDSFAVETGWLHRRGNYEAFDLFTDRGIYRPGETVHFKGIGRLFGSRGIQVPKGEPVELVIRSLGPGSPGAKIPAKLDEFGTFSADWTAPSSIKLGYYEGRVCLAGDSANDCGRAIFQLGEYRPTEFTVEASLDRRTYVRGDPVQCTMSARYLFGSPVRDGRAFPWLRSTLAWFRPSGLEQYAVSGAGWQRGSGLGWQTGTTNVPEEGFHLDREGSYTHKDTLSPGAYEPVALLTCEPTVQDLSRQAVAGRTSSLVHPAEFYLAMKPISTSPEPGQAIAPEVLAVEPEGKRRVGVPIRLELFRNTTRKWGDEALDSVGSCTVSSAAAPTSCVLRAADPGQYRIRADAADSRGNRVRVDVDLFVRTAKPTPTAPTVAASPTAGIQTDRQRYSVGDVARVTLKSTFPEAEALVGVTREGILTWRRASVHHKTAAFDLPITDDLVPEVRLTALFLRPRTAPRPAVGPDIGAPAQESAESWIEVDPSGHHLQVALSPSAAVLRPGSPIEVGVQVLDASGSPKPAQVTVYAVDEGVLALTNYATPDPFPTFFSNRDTRSWSSDLRRSMFWIPAGGRLRGVHRTRPPQVRMGATSVDRKGMSFRRDLRAVAYYNPDVRTDSQGRAKVSFKLPDSLTSYRIMAVALNADSFGSASANVTTSLPLMLRPALPRVLRIGDQVDASALLTSEAAKPVNVNVTMSVEGAGATAATTKTTTVGPGRTAELRFPVQAASAGKALFRFSAVSSDRERDRIELARKILAPTVVQTVALYGETSATAGEQLGDLATIHPNVGGLTVTLASSPLVGLDASFEQLLEYPYGCTEQLTSKLFALLPLRELAAAAGVAPLEGERELQALTIEKVLSRQKTDGGFGYWPDSRQSDPWVSVQTLWVLGQAAQRGAKVDSSAVDRARHYVSEVASGAETESAVRVFAMDVLAEQGVADSGVLEPLFASRQELPVDARALLLHALVVSQGPASQIATLRQELEASLRVDGPIALAVDGRPGVHDALTSSARTSAMVLRALLAVDSRHPFAVRLVRGLLAARRGGSWRTTQETAWALLAIEGWWRAQSVQAPSFRARAFLGDHLLKEASFVGASLRTERVFVPAWSLGRGGDTIAFESSGTGTLYYDARLQYGLRSLPDQPEENGFAVDRELSVQTPTGAWIPLRLAGGSVRAGRVVRCRLLVATSTPRSQVVVDVPVPAGLEILDPTLATSEQRGPSSLISVTRLSGLDPNKDAQRPGEFWVEEREVRDDRMAFFVEALPAGMYSFQFHARATAVGAFVAPPATVQEMYAPETFGRTAAEVVRIEGQ